MLVCIAGLLLYWDILLKTMHAVSTRLARWHLDRAVSDMARLLLAIAKTYGGLTLKVDPRISSDLHDATLFCANHQSVADIAVLIATLKNHRLRFVAKIELSRGFPAVSEVLRIQQHALIHRHGSYRSTIAALTKLGRRAASGVSPVVFPEGSRSRTGKMKTFQEGAIRTLLEANPMTVTALAIDGGSQFHSMATLRRGLKDVTYRIKYVGAVPGTSDKSGIQNVLLECRALIERQMEEWNCPLANGAE